MLARYLKVYRKHLVFLLVLIALVYISSVTKGKTATITSYIAGAIMLAIGLFFIVWIIKTPTKNDNDPTSWPIVLPVVNVVNSGVDKALGSGAIIVQYNRFCFWRGLRL